MNFEIVKQTECAMGKNPNTIWTLEADGIEVFFNSRKWIVALALEMIESGEIECRMEGIDELHLIRAGAQLDDRAAATNPETRAKIRNLT